MPRPTISTTFNAIDKITSPMKKMQRNMKVFAIGAGVAIGAASVGIRKFVTEAAKIEDAVAAFQPLVGGVAQAEAIVDKLNQTAATTPFQLENLSDATKTLLGFGAATEKNIIPVLRMLGDASGGSADKLNSISLAYGQIQAKGKTSMKEINQLINAGVPIIGQLTDVTGTSAEKLFEMVRAGEITGDVVTKAFQRMTSEGGIFFNGMEIASATFTGKMSTLRDNIDLTAAAIGKQLMPTLKPLIDRGIEIAGMVREWVNNNQELINQKIQDFIAKVTKVATTFYRLWDSGVIPAIIAGVLAFKLIIGAIKTYQAVLQTAKAVQLAFNVAAGANPIGLIIIAVAALVAGLVLLIKNWKKVKEVILNVWNAIKEPFEKVAAFFGSGVSGAGADISAAQQRGSAAAGGGIPGLVGRNDGMISQTSVSRSEVGINIAGLPQGSSVRQRGKAEGVSLNYAYGTGGL